MMLRLLHVVSLLLVAMALAFALAHAAELPGKRRLDRDRYLVVQRIYHPGFTIGGISEPASTLALAALLILTPPEDSAFGWFVAAFAAMIGMQAVYWVVTHPVNRFWLRGEKLPAASARFFDVGGGAGTSEHDRADWVRLRDRWEYSHLVRACLALLGLIFLSLGVTG